MAADEQAMELEALQSIYMEDLEMVETEGVAFQIKIAPNQGNEAEGNHVGAFLKIKFTAGYPEEAPDWVCREAFGLTRAQVDELREFCSAYLREHLGPQMIFGWTEAIREWLAERNTCPVPVASSSNEEAQPPMSAEEAEEAALLAALEEESKDPLLGGTIITKELFEGWWTGFCQEMETNGTPVIPRKDTTLLTGRQLFERDATLHLSDLADFS